MEQFSWHKPVLDRLLAAPLSLPHALLLSGPRGIGKLAFARALGQALLCEAPAAQRTACGACAACNWVEADSHPDFRTIEPAVVETEGEATEKKTSIGVNQIRALADFIGMTSHRGGFRTVVVHPAEAMNANAANALLKNLEEPPPRTVFMLVTHRPHQLLPTIRSRCQQIALAPPPRAAAAEWLASHGVRDPDVALAHMGEAPLLALELQGTDFWGARTAFLRHLGKTPPDVLALGEAAADMPIPDVLAWLQKWSYDIVHYQGVQRVRYNPDFTEAIAHAAARARPLAVMRFHREVVKLQRLAHHPLNARLFVEHLLLAYRDVLEREALAA